MFQNFRGDYFALLGVGKKTECGAHLEVAYFQKNIKNLENTFCSFIHLYIYEILIEHVHGPGSMVKVKQHLL